MRKLLPLIFFLGSLNNIAIAQAINDECLNAIFLPIDTICNPTTYSTSGATASSGIANPSCGIYAGADVWFACIVPSSGRLQIKLVSSNSAVMYYQLYTGGCGSLSAVACVSSNSFYNMDNSSLAGTAVYIRVWRQNSVVANSFTFCIKEPPALPNDYCAQATPLTVTSSINLQPYSITGSTAEASTVAINPSCGNYNGGDIWFSVVVPLTGKLRIEQQGVSPVQSAMSIYSGSCGNFTLLNCLSNNGDFNIHNTLLAGQTIFIRVYDVGNDQVSGSILIGAWEPNTMANDFCANAIPLQVSASCTMSNNITTVGCTAEPTDVAPNPPCGFYIGSDLWYKFTLPMSGHAKIERAHIDGLNPSFAVYSGNCGNFSLVTCAGMDAQTNIHEHALAGQTLYIRIWSTNSSSEETVFQLCVWEPNTQENDFCSNAISLAVNSSCTLSPTYSTVGCTAEASSISPSPNCGFYSGNDQWFSFVMPTSGHLQLLRNHISGTTISMAIYSGTCGAMAQVACLALDDFVNIHNHALGGQVMYLRAWSRNSSFATGTFNFCLWEPNTPENDSCSLAQLLTVGVTCSLTAYSKTGCTSEATSVAANPNCGFYYKDDIWFKFIMPANGIVAVTRTQVSPLTAAIALYSGSCGAFNQLICSNNQSSFNYVNTALAGQTIYLRLWDVNDIDGTEFSLCVSEPSCIVIMDSITTTPSTCSATPDAALQVHATCYLCTSTLEYSIDNGPYQNSSTFSNIYSGSHSNIKIRDSGNPSCIYSSSSLFIIPTLQNAAVYYQDMDLDGYGKTSSQLQSCSPVQGYVLFFGDCNDGDANIHPGVIEIPCNSIDENCNGLLDDTPSEIEVLGNCNEVFDNTLVPSSGNYNGTNFGTYTINDSLSHTFEINNDNFFSPLIIGNISITGTHASDFSITNFAPGTSILPNGNSTFQILFNPSTQGIKNATVTIYSNDCNEAAFDFAITGTATTDLFSTVEVNAMHQGYYLGSLTLTTALLNQNRTTCNDVCDSITISLYDANTYQLVSNSKVIWKTNGIAIARFQNISGNYYISLKHRNSVEVWSANPVSLSAGNTTFYDFTSSPLNTYGANVTQVEPGVWALYSGDVNQDGSVDAFDYVELDPDITFGVSGYYSTDINGDGSVDSFDYVLFDPNLITGISALIP